MDVDELKRLFKKQRNEISAEDITVDIFKIPFLNVFNRFALFKKKYLRANQNWFDLIKENLP